MYSNSSPNKLHLEDVCIKALLSILNENDTFVALPTGFDKSAFLEYLLGMHLSYSRMLLWTCVAFVRNLWISTL